MLDYIKLNTIVGKYNSLPNFIKVLNNSEAKKNKNEIY